MTDSQPKQITERELREAELQMAGNPPSTATGFIGFVAARPPAAPSTSSSGSSARP